MLVYIWTGDPVLAPLCLHVLRGNLESLLEEPTPANADPSPLMSCLQPPAPYQARGAGGETAGACVVLHLKLRSRKNIQ